VKFNCNSSASSFVALFVSFLSEIFSQSLTLPPSHVNHKIFDMKAFISFMFAACLTIAFSCVAIETVFAQSDQTQQMDTASNETPYVTGITTGRARSLVGVVLGLVSLIIGLRVKRHSADGAGNIRKWRITALALGSVAVILSIIHLTTLSGGFGTGGGKAGAIVAFVLGIIGMCLGGFALLRSRQS
jgi:hypothetical protein